MKKYQSINGNETKKLKIEVYYNKGGMNYWNGKVNERGYYLSVQPVELSNSGGVTIESFIMGSGVAKFLMPVKRQSEKAMQQAVELAKSFEAELCTHILNKSNI